MEWVLQEPGDEVVCERLGCRPQQAPGHARQDPAGRQQGARVAEAHDGAVSGMDRNQPRPASLLRRTRIRARCNRLDDPRATRTQPPCAHALCRANQVAPVSHRPLVVQTPLGCSSFSCQRRTSAFRPISQREEPAFGAGLIVGTRARVALIERKRPAKAYPGAARSDRAHRPQECNRFLCGGGRWTFMDHRKVRGPGRTATVPR